MPSYLRNFYFAELVAIKKEENKQAQKHNVQSKKTSTVNRANINPRFKR